MSPAVRSVPSAPMTTSEWIGATELRARFARSLASLYGSEVPAYNTLVAVSREVNDDVLAARGGSAERLGDIDRVTAERHGAIRVGSPVELAQVTRIFAAFGMHPVGFYDLRESDGSGVPVVSTAFRPTQPDELAANPFRVFTSMLAVDDERFFDPQTRARLVCMFDERQLFGPDLLSLADRAAAENGLRPADADTLLQLATEAFRLSRTPIDRSWYDHLSSISSVAADIGGQPSTHINHLTPRVLDIDELYRRMQDRGVEMIDAIQGPPRWDGPDVLLRQTSFRALAEPRWFTRADGTSEQGELRVRFGEVEQRGIALTRSGLDRYEQAMTRIARERHALPPAERSAHAVSVWEQTFPRTEDALARESSGWFTVTVARTHDGPATPRVSTLVDAGVLRLEPIVYEDFLPRSAAGIFRSNLTSTGSRDDSRSGPDYDSDRLAGIVGRTIADPQELYWAQRSRSIDDAGRVLGLRLHDDLDPRAGPARRQPNRTPI